MNESKNTHVVVNTGTLIRFFLITVLLLVLYYISDVILVIVAAIVIASAIEPLIRRLKRRKIHRIVSVIVIYVLLALALAGILIFFLPLVVNDMVTFLNGLPHTISLGNLWSPLSSVGGDTVATSQSLSGNTISIYDFVDELKSLIAGTSAEVFKTASVLFGGVLSFLLIVILSFYLAVQEDGVGDFLRIVAPVKHHDYVVDLWARSQRKMALWLQGQIVLGIIVGILVYIVLLIVGIPHALLLAVLAGLFEIIPVFGPIISAIPAVATAFAERGLGIGLLLVGLYIVIQQLEGQLFYPLVVKKVVGISPIVVILALVIGAKLAGVLGALIAVPLSAALMEYIHDIEKYKNAERAERAVINKKTNA
jgi:predicted PurR-regulated permease PerM